MHLKRQKSLKFSLKQSIKKTITLLVGTGIIHGNSGRLMPFDTTTRAEMAQVLYNLMTR